MIRVLLINQVHIPHFRIPVYGYLSHNLKNYGFDLMVAAEGIQAGNPHPIEFDYIEATFSTRSIYNLIRRQKADAIISWVDMKHLYLFPMYFVAKGILRKKVLYWGQGRDLLNLNAHLKNFAYAAEQSLCDAIILYAEHLKKYIRPSFHKKIFVANNSLCINYPGLRPENKKTVLREYGIQTKKNIICMGRMQKRKRLEQLFKAFDLMNRPDIGLILVGPDPDGVLNGNENSNIYKLGPIYGDKKFDLLCAADVYCLPGAVGLSIVDALFCGLPFVTENGDESAEIGYLKDGINGFVVPRGNIQELAKKLLVILDNNELRQKLSEAARREYIENAHIDQMCEGFRNALDYAIGHTIRKQSKD